MNTVREIRLEANKNKTYRLHFPLFAANSAGLLKTNVMTSWDTLNISKDGAAFASLANTPVSIGSGWYYIDLTATEMNAEFVTLNIAGIYNVSSVSGYECIQIATNGIGLSSLVSDLAEVSVQNPTFGEVLSFVWYLLRNGNSRKTWTLKKFTKECPW